MTTTKVIRLTRGSLDGSFLKDRGKRIVVSFIPGDGDKVADRLELRPLRTRRAETITVTDAYRFALRCRANLEYLEKARERKAVRLARQRQDRAERRLLKA